MFHIHLITLAMSNVRLLSNGHVVGIPKTLRFLFYFICINFNLKSKQHVTTLLDHVGLNNNE